MRLACILFLAFSVAIAGPKADPASAVDTNLTENDDLLDLRSDQASSCASGVHILAVGGHNALPKAYGLLISTVRDIRRAIPGSISTSIAYDKKSEDYPEATQKGQEHLTAAIKQYASECPNTPLVILGYSEGAIVTMNTLCGRSHAGSPWGLPLPIIYTTNILATIVYGDETRIPNQSYNRGTCTQGQGVNPRQDPLGCIGFASNIRSYCDKPDPECCHGRNHSSHFVYPKKYNTKVVKFVSGRFRNRIGILDRS